MAIHVDVLRVFTAPDGGFGNPLGVIDAAAVDPAHRQDVAAELGYSETIFVDIPDSGASTAHLRIFTPAAELPFAGHPTVGAAWWLRNRGIPVRTLQVPAGLVQVGYDEELTSVSARADWAPEFAIHDLGSVEELAAADPADYADDVEHYLWTWTDRDAGHIRSRMFAAHLGIPEDEATGAAAVRITEHLSRDLTILQGKGSSIVTSWSADGWVRIAGRVVEDDSRQLESRS